MPEWEAYFRTGRIPAVLFQDRRPAEASDAPAGEWSFDELLAAVESGDRRCRQISLVLDLDPRGPMAERLVEVLEAAQNTASAERLRREHLSALATSRAKT